MTDLRKLAEAAQELPFNRHRQIDFRESFSPSVVLALLDERDELMASLKEWVDIFHTVGDTPEEVGTEWHRVLGENRDYAKAADDMEAAHKVERDELMETIDGLRGMLIVGVDETVKLQAAAQAGLDALVHINKLYPVKTVETIKQLRDALGVK